MIMKETSTKASALELPDDATMSAGANYEHDDPYEPNQKEPGYYYFAAANDNDTSRPDGIARLLTEGYELCTTEKITAPDCKLMRIPIEMRNKKEARKRALRAQGSIQDNKCISGVPVESTVKFSDHGQIRKVK
jgi:hypothetical protein